MLYIIIILIGVVVLQAVANYISNKKKISTHEKRAKEKEFISLEETEDEATDQNVIDFQYPYHKKYLLTKNEYYFYKKLKPITDNAKLQILAKIRLADLLDVNNGLSKSEWGKYFSKIKSKHIDFAIADDMKIIALIELDDNSHQRQDRVVRDNFVNSALNSAGYTVVRTSGDINYIQHIIDDYQKV